MAERIEEFEAEGSPYTTWHQMGRELERHQERPAVVLLGWLMIKERKGPRGRLLQAVGLLRPMVEDLLRTFDDAALLERLMEEDFDVDMTLDRIIGNRKIHSVEEWKTTAGHTVWGEDGKHYIDMGEE